MKRLKNTPAKKPTSVATPEYKPTEKERSIFDKFLAGYQARPSPRIKVTKSGDGSTWELPHPAPAIGYALLAQAVGTADLDFLDGLLSQLIRASTSGGVIDEKSVNFMLSIVKGIEPRDQVEALLATQMAAVHMAAMAAARQLPQADYVQQYDSAERALNKLARTFAAQIETLKRYRTGGEQKVTVHHVSVSDGGQAIVGNVTQSSHKDASEKAPLTITDAPVAPMPILDEGSVRAPARLRRKK